jgi:hypothetical protein
MNIFPTLLALLLTTLPGLTLAQAPVNQDESPRAAEAEAPSTAPARQSLDQLQLAMQELKALLAAPNRETALIKTKTSWIRKYLTNIHAWIEQQPTSVNPDNVLDDFRTTIGDMLLEVTRDDMLDANELQSLMTHYTTAENLFYQIEQRK